MSEYKFGTWYPIDEDTPHDCDVIMYCPERCFVTNRERCELGTYASKRGGWSHAWATHWMPLPEPPPSNGKRKPEDPSTDDRLNQTVPDWMNHAEAIGTAMKGDE